MTKKLYTLNTVNNFMELIFKPFGMPFAQENPDINIFNIMDDSLLKDTLAAGHMTPVIASRLLAYAKAAEASGADGVLVTCTSVNEATAFIRPLLSIPILNIEEPVADEAVINGQKIGVLATLPTSPAAIGRTIARRAKEYGKQVEVVNRVADGAFDVLCAGNRAKHDEMVNDALYKLAKEVDVIAFAQISMSLLKHDAVQVPLYKIGTSGFTQIKALMDMRS
ncbi:MAG: aspartate/glutamate racemase family protein [Firmicutes bacterium]|nr:aspartate/glutamate racemase family protein [Bacillota bacterium]